MPVNENQNREIQAYTDGAAQVSNALVNMLDTEFSKTEVKYEEESLLGKFLNMLRIHSSDLKSVLPIFMVIALYGVIVYLNIGLFTDFYLSVVDLDVSELDVMSYGYHIVTISPIIIWLAQTNIEALTYHRLKYGLYLSILLLSVARLTVFFYYVSFRFWVPQLTSVSTSEDVSAEMIISFTYIIVFTFTLVGFSFLAWFAHKLLKHRTTYEVVSEFKLRHYFSSDGGKLEYTLKILKNMEDGKWIPVKEKDRYLHSNVTGSTGTGKTSMIFLVQIFNDLLKRKMIVTAVKKKLKKMVKRNMIYINRPFDDKDFCYEYFTPNPGYEKHFEKVKNKYRLIGITFVAPDNDSTDKICNLFEVFKLGYNRIDPEPEATGNYKTNTKGINILQISPRLPKWAVSVAISKKATLLADVMQKNFEQSGKSDPYFSSVNRIATTTLAVLLMVTYKEMHGKDPHIGHVQDLLNDFSKITYYKKKLDRMDTDGRYHAISDIITAFFIQNTKFKEHCSGLISQFNNLLSNELIRNMLCTNDSIDIDEALENSRMTVVNIALGALGAVNSPSFGQFFMNSYVDSVVRRPGSEDTRPPHALYIDEFSIIVNEALEPLFTLARKYRIMVNVAIQSLAQFKGNYAHFKEIVTSSCGHLYVFGRASVEDMKTYSIISGQKEELIHQETFTTSSVFNEKGNTSYSDRTTPNLKLNQEENEIRYKDFKELLFATTRDGRPLPAMHAKANFNKKSAYKKRSVYTVDWKKLECVQGKEGISVSTKERQKLEKQNEKASSEGTLGSGKEYLIEQENNSSVVQMLDERFVSDDKANTTTVRSENNSEKVSTNENKSKPSKTINLLVQEPNAVKSAATADESIEDEEKGNITQSKDMTSIDIFAQEVKDELK